MKSEEYHEKIKGCATLDELFEVWKTKKPETIAYKKDKNITIDHSKNVFITDGIVDKAWWDSNKGKRILFVLKEAYGSDDGQNWSLTERISMSYSGEKPLHNKSVWPRVANWTRGLMNTDKSTIFPYKYKISDEENREYLDHIAVMNLKKSGGDSVSDMNEIEVYAEYDQNELMKEFELIDADIIICGFTFNVLLTKIFGMEPLNNDTVCDNYFYYLDIAGRERLFIDFFHPKNHWDDLVNYYGVVNCYQQALLAKDKLS